MTDSFSGYSIQRSSRAVGPIMVVICAMFVFALCTGYCAAAENPNLVEQMEGHFGDLSSNAISWSAGYVNQDALAQTDDFIGLRSESADWILEPEDGFIKIVDYYLPEGDIPLCVDQAWLDQFYVVVEVYGGYELLDMCLMLEQKGECYAINIVLVDQWKGDCCADDYYLYGLRLPDGVDKYCFDANNFPEVAAPFTLWHDPDVDDLQKEIYVKFCSLWTGCELPDQEFLISLVHKNMDNLS